MEKIKFKYNPRYLWILVMLSLTFTLFNHLPIFQRHYVFLFLGFALMFFYARGLFRTNYFVAVILHLFIIFLNFISGDVYFGSTNMILKETIVLMLPLGMFYCLREYSEKPLFHLMFIIFTVFLIESTVVAVIANNLYPGIMRATASSESLNESYSILLPFQRLGMSDYSMPHALPVLVPGLVYGIRNTDGFYKKMFIALIATALLLVYVSNSTTALILTTIVFVFSLLINPKKSSKNAISLFVLFLIITPVFTNKDVQIGILDRLNAFIPEDANIHRKINDIEDSIIYEDVEGTVENRSIKYVITINEFMRHPILGTNELTGGHSSLLDRFANLGLVGSIPFVLFLIFFTKSVLRCLPQNRRFYYLVGLFSALVMLFLKNAMSWAMWLMTLFLLPGILLFMGDDKTD